MRYLLDANAVISLLRANPQLSRRLREHHPQDFGLPTMVAHELFYGAFKSQRVPENLARVEALRFEVLTLDREDARQAGEIRAMLARVGMSIGPLDTLIAGQARARNLTLITHNTGEFSRVNGLRIEDWEI